MNLRWTERQQEGGKQEWREAEKKRKWKKGRERGRREDEGDRGGGEKT